MGWCVHPSDRVEWLPGAKACVPRQVCGTDGADRNKAVHLIQIIRTGFLVIFDNVYLHGILDTVTTRRATGKNEVTPLIPQARLMRQRD